MKLSEFQATKTKSYKDDVMGYLRSCKHKFKHFSRADALVSINSGKHGKTEDLAPYRCRFCENWHVGHSREFYDANKKLLPEDQRKQYLTQIVRLQKQNRLLTEALLDERTLRRQAYAWYKKRLQSRFWWLLDMLLMRRSDGD